MGLFWGLAIFVFLIAFTFGLAAGPLGALVGTPVGLAMAFVFYFGLDRFMTRADGWLERRWPRINDKSQKQPAGAIFAQAVSSVLLLAWIVGCCLGSGALTIVFVRYLGLK